MRISHVNTGTKAKYKVSGTKLQLSVEGAEAITLDLDAELKDVAATVDVSLNQGFIKLERGVGNWYVASIKIPAREFELVDTGKLDKEGWPIYTEEPLPVNMRDVVLCLWGVPENIGISNTPKNESGVK
ncbi:MAG: hypothetical protein RSE04_06075 [Hydrogenoanaerobacterium sp.]